MTYDTIIYEVSDKVATITLNRPDVLNAFDVAMCREFRDVWQRIREDDAVNAVVLCAAGERAFCTGVDINNGGNVTFSENIWNQIDPGDMLGPRSNGVWKPVVIAIHGMFAGGAFYWLNEADIAICSTDATFFDPHITYGLVSAVEPVGLRHRAPYSEILRMVLMGNGERIGAETAMRISLVTEVTDRAVLRDRAREIAATIARHPTMAVQGSIRAMWESLDFPRTAAVRNATRYTQLGNPLGQAAIDKQATIKARKSFRTR